MEKNVENVASLFSKRKRKDLDYEILNIVEKHPNGVYPPLIQTFLSQKLNISERTVERHISKLVKHNVLEIENQLLKKVENVRKQEIPLDIRWIFSELGHLAEERFLLRYRYSEIKENIERLENNFFRFYPDIPKEEINRIKRIKKIAKEKGCTEVWEWISSLELALKKYKIWVD